MGDLPCPPYSNKRLEARMISKEKLPKICLVASATKHFSAKTLKCISKVKQSVQTSGTAGDVVIFLATTAVLEVVRRLSKARCPFIWHGLQALQALCYPPFKWVQKWVPLEPLVRQLQVGFCSSFSAYNSCNSGNTCIHILNLLCSTVNFWQLLFLVFGCYQFIFNLLYDCTSGYLEVFFWCLSAWQH